MMYLYKMKCITNMHVGSGDTNYNIIDKEVQKDVVLNNPVIHASGLKGALRAYFESKWGKGDDRIKNIFGSEDATSPGQYEFFDAKLVARPLRVSEGDRPYLLATGLDILKDFLAFLSGMRMSGFNISLPEKIEKNTFVSDSDVVKLEGFEVERTKIDGLEKLIGDNYAVANSIKIFDLPVIAHNKLDDNGISKNLWFEEVVPHESIFYFAIKTPADTKNELDIDGETIQFGANASIGQGYTAITLAGEFGEA